MLAIYKKEFSTQMRGMIGFVVIAFLLLGIGIYTAAYNMGYGISNFEFPLQSASFIFLLLMPILTMNSFAAERRNRTDQLLLTSPVKVSGVVLGKYLGMVTVLFIPVVIMAFYPLILSLYGDIHFPTAYATLLAFFLLGASLISVGMFVSSLVESPIIAAVISVAVLVLGYFMPSLTNIATDTALSSMIAFIAVSLVIALIVWLMTKSKGTAALVGLILCALLVAGYLLAPQALSGSFTKVLGCFSIFSRMEGFVTGIFDVTALVYYLSVIVLFNFLTMQSIEKRRWG